ncbi:MAG TPA: MmgE/PrpD family protein, partial [Thermoleophilaceae bacterium]|nr:MmgE/PrpD family protein [Thermoleophilaceae bacterium]
MPYRTAFLDWLACASAGREEPAARAAEAAGDGLLERVLFAGTAGHVLDFDDTYLPGLAHLSAPTAPAALVLGAALGRSVGEVVAAYTSGFEAMGAVARASHPALYDGGWHPTAVCGVVGAAISAAQLLGLSTERERAAVAIALLRAGGLRAAFGSDGKALQVGMAAAAGVSAARLAEGGASVPLDEAARGAAGFEAVFGASFAEPSEEEPAVRENWIKAWPCCLQIHGSIEAADRARADGLEPGTPVELIVHPISLEAARCGPQPADGLQAKFSIYYCTAFTLLHGPPGL